jgi:hypothetical protein
MHVVGHQNTTASMVVVVPAGHAPGIRVWAALGNPCVSVYAPIGFGHAVPSLLGDEAMWWRFARLRDRVEADPGAIGRIRAVLAPVEAALVRAGANLSALDTALTTLGV